MHNHSGPAPEFISLQSGSSATAAAGDENTGTASEGSRTLPSKRGRGRGGLNNTTSTSHRGRYGPPNYPRGLASSNFRENNDFTKNTTRSKRKREPTSGQDSGEDSTTTTTTTTTAKHLDIIRMPWHPPGLSRYSPGIVGLHEEIEDFYQWMIPTVEEHHARLSVVDRVRKSVKGIYPHARVEIFGSFRTGLYLPTSDIDLVICGKWPQLPFGDLSDALQHLAKPGSLKVLERAAVPIIKLADDLTGIKVDISFNMANGLRAVELVKHYKKRYPALPKLIYVLKQFLYQRDLNEVYSGGLSSYALILMVVSFLQQHVREDARSTKANLGVLLVEFFELYGVHFNCTRTAIRITDDGAYLPKDETLCYQGGGYGTICIEDPFDAHNDVGKSSYGFPSVKTTFELTYFHLLKFVTPAVNAATNDLSLLSQIIRVGNDVTEFRRSIANVINQQKHLDTKEYNDDSSNSEDPLCPLTPIKIPSKDVTPKELPDRYFVVPSPDLKKKDNQINNENKKETNHVDEPEEEEEESTTTTNSRKILQNGFNKTHASTKAEHQDNMSDNLSGVSMGTSSLSSDTDSDGANGGQVSPNSAMSISPASSEVGSCLVNGSSPASASALRSKKPGNTKESSNTSTSDFTKNSSSSKKLIKGGNSTNSTRTSASGRSTGSNQQQPAGVDRSDLDLNWRQSSKGSNAKTLSADEDPNWRDRDHKTESNSKTSWAKTSKSKNSNNELDSSRPETDSKVNDNTNSNHEVLDPDSLIVNTTNTTTDDDLDNTIAEQKNSDENITGDNASPPSVIKLDNVKKADDEDQQNISVSGNPLSFPVTDALEDGAGVLSNDNKKNIGQHHDCKRTDSKRRKRTDNAKRQQQGGGNGNGNRYNNKSKNNQNTNNSNTNNSNSHNCSTSSKDTSAESDVKPETSNSTSTNQVSRLPGQIKPKR